MARCARHSLQSVYLHGGPMSKERKPDSFYLKLVNISDTEARVVLIRDSKNGKPIAQGVLMKLEGAARSTFRDAVLSLDGGKILPCMVDSGI